MARRSDPRGDRLFHSYSVAQKKILAVKPTGASFDDVEISTSGQFKDLYPNRVIPPFVWLRVGGQVGKDDFGLSTECNLVVSHRILNILKDDGMSHADVTDFSST